MHDFWQGGEGIELIARFIEICSYGIEQGNGKHNRLPSVKKIRDFTVNGEKKEQNKINVTKITIFSIT